MYSTYTTYKTTYTSYTRKARADWAMLLSTRLIQGRRGADPVCGRGHPCLLFDNGDCEPGTFRQGGSR